MRGGTWSVIPIDHSVRNHSAMSTWPPGTYRNAPPSVMSNMAARIEGAKYRCLPGVGHLAHMEAPKLVNPMLVSFLLSHL